VPMRFPTAGRANTIQSGEFAGTACCFRSVPLRPLPLAVVGHLRPKAVYPQEQCLLAAEAANVGTCPLCGGGHFARRGPLNLLTCHLCDLTFDARVWEEGFALRSEAEWFDGDTPARISAWVRVFEQANNRRTYGRIARLVPQGGSLLEVGVGSGSFLAFARRRGLAVEGCDLSRSVCQSVCERTGIRVFYGPVSALPAGKAFDAVIMNHVLEHVCSPVEFLRDVRIRLRSNGILHIAVPNVDSWEAAFAAWPGYEPYHLTYFSPETLETAVRQAGFSVIRTTTHESLSGWFLTALRSVFKQRVHDHQFMAELRKKRQDSWMEFCYGATLALVGAATTPMRCLQA
jgi:2-polyprenyl-3-methyl-5-hydroxy-6-metoxy-1,4-benzoquinol methylase